MLKKVLLLAKDISFLLIVVLLCSMERPAPDARITKNFGMNDGGTPVLGETLEFEGNIAAAEAGEVIFSVSDDDKANSIPSPFGVWTAVDHGDGLIGIYARLGNEQSYAFAVAGKSGWTSRSGFYFSFFDRKERRWVNPALIVGNEPDTEPPIVRSVRLRNDNGDLIDLSAQRTIRQGRYSIEVDASDKQLVPYKILTSLNGVEVGSIALEIFSAKDGVLMVHGFVPAQRVYAHYPSLEVASNVWFTRGQASLEVIVSDFNANIAARNYRIYVE
jgi:hypothetical protein